MNASVVASGSHLAFILAVKQELVTRNVAFHVLQRGNIQARVPQMLEGGPCRLTLGISADEKKKRSNT
jgi:hypothetical protein